MIQAGVTLRRPLGRWALGCRLWMTRLPVKSGPLLFWTMMMMVLIGKKTAVAQDSSSGSGDGSTGTTTSSCAGAVSSPIVSDTSEVDMVSVANSPQTPVSNG